MFVNEDKKQIKDKSLEYGVLCNEKGRPIAAVKVSRVNAMYRILYDLLCLVDPGMNPEQRYEESKKIMNVDSRFTTPNTGTLSTKEGCKEIIEAGMKENHLLATLEFLINPEVASSSLTPTLPGLYKGFKSKVGLPSVSLKNDKLSYSRDVICPEQSDKNLELIKKIALEVKQFYKNKFADSILDYIIENDVFDHNTLNNKRNLLKYISSGKTEHETIKTNNSSFDIKKIKYRSPQSGSEISRALEVEIAGKVFKIGDAKVIEHDNSNPPAILPLEQKVIYFVGKNEKGEDKRYYINKQTGFVFETDDVGIYEESSTARVFDGKKWHGTYNNTVRDGFVFAYRKDNGDQCYCSPVSNSLFTLYDNGRTKKKDGTRMSVEEFNRSIDRIIELIEKEGSVAERYNSDDDELGELIKKTFIKTTKAAWRKKINKDTGRFIFLLQILRKYGPLCNGEVIRSKEDIDVMDQLREEFGLQVYEGSKDYHKNVFRNDVKYIQNQMFDNEGWRFCRDFKPSDPGTHNEIITCLRRYPNNIAMNAYDKMLAPDYNFFPSEQITQSKDDQIWFDEMERAQYLIADNAVNAQNQEQNLKKIEAHKKAIADAKKLKENDEPEAGEKNKKKEESEAQKKERDEKVREMVRAQLRQDLKNAVNQLKSVQEKNIFERFLHFLFNLFSDDYKIYKQAVNTIGALNEQGVFAGNQKNVQIVKDAIDEARNKLYIKKPVLIQYNVGINLNSINNSKNQTKL